MAVLAVCVFAVASLCVAVPQTDASERAAPGSQGDVVLWTGGETVFDGARRYIDSNAKPMDIESHTVHLYLVDGASIALSGTGKVRLYLAESYDSGTKVVRYVSGSEFRLNLGSEATSSVTITADKTGSLFACTGTVSDVIGGVTETLPSGTINLHPFGLLDGRTLELEGNGKSEGSIVTIPVNSENAEFPRPGTVARFTVAHGSGTDRTEVVVNGPLSGVQGFVKIWYGLDPNRLNSISEKAYHPVIECPVSKVSSGTVSVTAGWLYVKGENLMQNAGSPIPGVVGSIYAWTSGVGVGGGDSTQRLFSPDAAVAAGEASQIVFGGEGRIAVMLGTALTGTVTARVSEKADPSGEERIAFAEFENLVTRSYPVILYAVFSADNPHVTLQTLENWGGTLNILDRVKTVDLGIRDQDFHMGNLGFTSSIPGSRIIENGGANSTIESTLRLTPQGSGTITHVADGVFTVNGQMFMGGSDGSCSIDTSNATKVVVNKGGLMTGDIVRDGNTVRLTNASDLVVFVNDPSVGATDGVPRISGPNMTGTLQVVEGMAVIPKNHTLTVSGTVENGLSFTELVVEGTLVVPTGKSVNAPDGKLVVLGTVDSEETVNAGTVFVGFSGIDGMIPETSSGASFKGPVSAKGIYLLTGSDLDAACLKSIESYSSTSYIVGVAEPWLTVWAGSNNSSLRIDHITMDMVPDSAGGVGWRDHSTKDPVVDSVIGAVKKVEVDFPFSVNVVIVGDVGSGVVTPSVQKASKNQNVELHVDVRGGYRLQSIEASNVDKLIENHGEYSFTMPGCDVTVTATFVLEEDGVIPVVLPNMQVPSSGSSTSLILINERQFIGYGYELTWSIRDKDGTYQPQGTLTHVKEEDKTSDLVQTSNTVTTNSLTPSISKGNDVGEYILKVTGEKADVGHRETFLLQVKIFIDGKLTQYLHYSVTVKVVNEISYETTFALEGSAGLMVGVLFKGAVNETGGVVGLGAGNFRWYAVGLPPGLAMSAGGLVSGIPTKAGTFDTKIVVTDRVNGNVFTGSITLTVSGWSPDTGGFYYDVTENGVTGERNPGHVVVTKTGTLRVNVHALDGSLLDATVRVMGSDGTFVDAKKTAEGGYSVPVSGTGSYRVVVTYAPGNSPQETVSFHLTVLPSYSDIQAGILPIPQEGLR